MKADDKFLINLFVVLLFVLINPLYATSICALLNFNNFKINFSLFAVMFASSFGLFFFIRNWNMGSDAIYFLSAFQEAGRFSVRDILFLFDFSQTGLGPFWHVYLWILRNIIGNQVDFFAFVNLFLIFLLTAFLGKVVDEKRFVIVSACILFVSPGFFSNVYEVWRHTFALLLFFIGIFLLEADKHRRLARTLIYSSILFHVVCIPIVVGYELLTLFKKINVRSQRNTRFQVIQRYSIQIVVYAIFSLVAIQIAEEIFTVGLPSQLTVYLVYRKNIGIEESGYAYLFNPLTAFLIYYFWFNRKQISTNEVFIGINYFLLIGVFIVANLPSSPVGRAFYIFIVGASVLFAKLVLKNKKHGFLFLVYIMLFMFYTNIKHGWGNLVHLLGGDFLNPTYGLAGMILNLDKALPPSTIL